MSRLKWEIQTDAKQGITTLKAFEDAQAKTNRKMRDTDKTATGLSKKFGNLQSTLLKFTGVIGGAALLGGMTRMITGMADLGDNLAKTSTRLGIGTDELQKFRFVAERSGVATRTMEMALQRMIRRVSEAAQGTGEAVKAIEELGLNAQRLAAMSPDEMFLKITDAMNQVTNSGDRVRLMFKLFDSEGVALKQVMDQGGESIRELMLRFEELGGVMSEEAIQASVEYKDAMADLTVAFRGFKIEIVEEVVPSITTLTTHLTTLISKYGKLKAMLATQGFAPTEEEIAAVERLFSGRGGGGASFTDPEEWPGAGPPKRTEEDREKELEILNAIEARRERIFADWRRVRAEKQAEWDEEQAELRREQEKVELEAKQDYEDQFLAKELEGVEARVRARQDELQRKKEIEDLALKTTAKTYQATMAMSQAYTAWSGKQSETLFRIEQAAAIARSIMTTYVAVNEALANPPGPPWTYPIAAATLAWGLANVAIIAAQKPGGGTVGGGGGAPTATTTSSTGTAPAERPLVPTEREEGKGQFIVNVQGDFIGNEDWVIQLAERINEVGDEYDVVIRGDLREYE